MVKFYVLHTVELHTLTMSPNSKKVAFSVTDKKNNKHLISPFKKAMGAKEPRQHGFYPIYFLVIWISDALFNTFQDANAENIEGNQLTAPQVP